MKILLLAVALASTSSLIAHDYWCLNNHFSLYADYGYMRRQDVRDLSLVRQLPNRRVLDTKALEERLGWESAIRGGVLYHVTACHSWEATYTYYYPWASRRTVTGNNNLFFPFKNPDFGDDYHLAFKAKACYESRLQSGEFNYWGHLTPQRVNYFAFAWTAGFRYMRLRESLRLLFYREEDRSPYTINTLNNLYGIQLGGMLEVNPSECFTWMFWVKGAAFFNAGDNRVKIRDQNDQITIRAYEKSRWTDSYLLEAYGQLAYHFTSCLSIYAGYQGYILTGVVIAPNQRDIHTRSKRRINTKGQIVIDGVHAGLSFGF